MVPTGVTSKKVLIGAFITYLIIFSCKIVEALMLITNIIIALAPTKKPVPVANANMKVTNFFISLCISSESS